MLHRRTRSNAHGRALPGVFRRNRRWRAGHANQFLGNRRPLGCRHGERNSAEERARAPVTRNALSDSDKKTVIDGLLKACDEADGLKDGMIFNTSCRFDPNQLVCSGAKTDGCLTMSQASTLQKAFAGPKDSKGRQVYPGFRFDTGIAASQGIPGLLHGGANPVGPPFTDIGMDVDSAADRAASDPASSISETSRWTNLNSFSDHGGKLIFWHGLRDPFFSSLDTVDYYERMTKAEMAARNRFATGAVCFFPRERDTAEEAQRR